MRVAVWVAAATGWLISAPAAAWGDSWRDHEPVVIPIVVIVVVVGSSLWRDRTYYVLSSSDRGRVDDAVRGGTSTDTPGLDDIAIERLRRAARSGGSDRIVQPVVAAAFIAVPIVAAVRVSTLFLLALPLSGYVAVEAGRRLRQEDPRVRLARLMATDRSHNQETLQLDLPDP